MIEGIGYDFWEIQGPAAFTYTIGSLTGRQFDAFMFEKGEAWDNYRRDVARNMFPKNYGYTPILAELGTENCQGAITLDPDVTYIFVVDYSYVGQARENPDQWRYMYFTYALGGKPDGGDWGAPQSTGSRVVLSSFALLATLVTVFWVS